MTTPPPTRRRAAADLAEELLTDMELSRLKSSDIIRKASRLARLIDDADALEWLGFEISGFTKTANGLTPPAWGAAKRSGRTFWTADGDKKGEVKPVEKATTQLVGNLEATIEASRIQLASAGDRPISVSSANPNQFVGVPSGNAMERNSLNRLIDSKTATLETIMGTVYQYITSRYYELRFGNSAENAFETLRLRIDARINELVPDAVKRLAAAWDGASSDNPELWANAASTCRRLVKSLADKLQAPSEPINGRAMTDDKYINRLIYWIDQNTLSRTKADVTKSELEHFGARIDAAADTGNKGAHAEVTKLDASRFVVSTYLLVGDILELAPHNDDKPIISANAALQAGLLPELDA